eukprot:scpid60036/ scgid25341/ Coiled-coil domain-containing protein 105
MSELQATVGPRPWREASVKTIKVAQALAEQGDVTCHTARMYDPLPTGRDVLALQSNQRAHQYIRQSRDVVSKLHRALVEVSDEIRSTTRCKEALEKKLDHCRKDIHLNRQTAVIREERPKREKGYDGADSLIESELMQLQDLKAQLELQLYTVKEQLYELHDSRVRILANIQERSQVLKLSASHGFTMGARTDRRIRSAPVGHSRAASAPAVTLTTPTSRAGERTSSRSQPRPQSSAVRPQAAHERSVTFSGMDTGSTLPCTDEVSNSLDTAMLSVKESRRQRDQASRLMSDTTALQQAALRSVNDGLTQKVAETVTLKQHLILSEAETRASMHRNQRWLEHQELTQGYTMGPINSKDLTSRERLDRPLIRTYQSHPGTNLPEARELARNSNIMESSMRRTQRSLGMLRLAKNKLEADCADKHAAANVDSDAIRLRRRHGNHRWVQSNPLPRPTPAGLNVQDLSFAPDV